MEMSLATPLPIRWRAVRKTASCKTGGKVPYNGLAIVFSGIHTRFGTLIPAFHQNVLHGLTMPDDIVKCVRFICHPVAGRRR
jgi:hypothetical protein